MQKKSLIQSGNIKEDLLFWTNQYLSYKIQTYFRTSKQNSINDIVELKDKVQSSKSIDETKEHCAYAIKHGLKSLYKVIHGASKFYEFIIEYTSSIQNIDNAAFKNFKDSLHVAEGTAKNYINIAIELITYIENTNSDGFKFDIEHDKQRVAKVKKKARDAMSADEFRLFNKKITAYNYGDDEFTRVRDILILRFILLCGLKPSEVIELKLGESLIFNGNDLYLKISNRKEIIPIPRKPFIRFLNKYIELKQQNKDGYFFYGIREKDEQLNFRYIHRLIETMLEFSGIRKRENDAEMLRTSLAVYLYNNRVDGGQIVLNTIQTIMGHQTLAQTKEMIGFHDDALAIAADVFEKDLFE